MNEEIEKELNKIKEYMEDLVIDLKADLQKMEARVNELEITIERLK